jgi:beta-phosphoglucomutase-like phosphatase (HAD superfamily)
VIFDLDGTLIETEELKTLSYARAAVELRPASTKRKSFARGWWTTR